MSMGTFQPNFLHRLGNAWNAIKGVPVQPGALYPPQQRSAYGYLTFPGWDVLEKRAEDEGRKDLVRAKTAVTSPWVYADISAIANECSTSTLVVKERRGVKLEDVENHELEQIWESPNEHMGRSFVMSFWAWSYVLASKAYLYWVPDETGTSLKEVWPIPPWMIRPVPDAKSFISGYAFKSSADSPPILIPPEMITYSHSVNLFDVRDGMSFLAAAMSEIQADLAASAWNLNFFDTNNGVPDGAIMLAPDTVDQDIERVRMELRDFFGGTKRGIAVGRSGDLKWQEFGRSQKDMEFSQGREFASKIIGRTLGFPDGYWSDLANRANAEQARRTMISGAVWPLLVRLAEDMNAQRRGVVQRWYGEDMRVEFKDIRPEDKEAQRAELAAYQPFLLVNELREMVGQEAFPDDDIRGMMLVAEITKGAPLPGTPAALLLEDLQAEKDEAAAQALAAQADSNGGTVPGEEEEAPAEPPPPILGYHIEQGVVSRNEARERLSLPPEDETKSQNLRNLQAMLAVAKMATDMGIDLKVAASLVGLDIPTPEPKPTPPMPFGGGGPIPPKEDGTGAPPPPEEGAPPVAEAKAVDDLELWERKALKSFRRFKKADVSFDTNTVSLPEQVRIHEALKGADSIPAIKAAFRRPRTALGTALMDIRNRGTAPFLDEEEIDAEVKARRGGVDALLDSVDAEARQWAEEATTQDE
jgi:HK97 family phage portal protein